MNQSISHQREIRTMGNVAHLTALSTEGGVRERIFAPAAFSPSGQKAAESVTDTAATAARFYAKKRIVIRKVRSYATA